MLEIPGWLCLLVGKLTIQNAALQESAREVEQRLNDLEASALTEVEVNEPPEEPAGVDA